MPPRRAAPVAHPLAFLEWNVLNSHGLEPFCPGGKESLDQSADRTQKNIYVLSVSCLYFKARESLLIQDLPGARFRVCPEMSVVIVMVLVRHPAIVGDQGHAHCWCLVGTDSGRSMYRACLVRPVFRGRFASLFVNKGCFEYPRLHLCPPLWDSRFRWLMVI